jgi:hypothetical protein
MIIFVLFQFFSILAISMATAAKFVQPICLAYLVPLDVDVVLIKFHQFLIIPQSCALCFLNFQKGRQ